MTGWTPLYQQIIASSIWGTADHVRIAWITLLAVANKNGVAAVTVGGLARLANISHDKAQDAINVLSSPDADTLTQQNEGRRIERCDSGWRLLNWEKYREMAKAQLMREAQAEASARYRAKLKGGPSNETESNKSEYLPSAKNESNKSNHREDQHCYPPVRKSAKGRRA